MKFAVYEVREDEKGKLAELAAKYSLDLALTASPLTMETLPLAEGASGVSTLGQSEISREMLAALKDRGIRAYSCRCVGVNHIDLPAARELGVRVSNASYSPHGVADYTVMLMLLLLRKYKPALWRGQVNDYSLGGLMGRELCRLTVGVVGTGRIGLTVMRSLSGFGCKMLCYDVKENPDAASLGRYVPLETLYRASDIITLHTPLTDSTRFMIGDGAIAQMKRDVLLINCARGELMDIRAVIEAIEEERIGGVALDVFADEAGIYHHDRRTDILKNRDMAYLRQFPNVIMTQHMAFYTAEAVESMVACGIESLLAFNEGKPYPCALA